MLQVVMEGACSVAEVLMDFVLSLFFGFLPTATGLDA
jgi:hypothetical protein